MPPGLLALVCYLNKFSGGMIHGISCHAAVTSCTRVSKFTQARYYWPPLELEVVIVGAC
jgi:hypothetical protein